MLPIPIWKQSDPRWKDVKIGKSNITLGEQGCAITALSMFLVGLGYNDNPLRVMEKLEAVGSLTDDGCLWWVNVHKAYPKAKFIYRWATTNVINRFEALYPAEAWRRVERLFQLGFAVPLHVNAGGAVGTANHFVTYAGNGYIHDPYWGERVPFVKRYGDPMKGLCGFVSIVGEPCDPEDGVDGQAVGKAVNVLNGNSPELNAKELVDTLLIPRDKEVPDWIEKQIN